MHQTERQVTTIICIKVLVITSTLRVLFSCNEINLIGAVGATYNYQVAPKAPIRLILLHENSTDKVLVQFIMTSTFMHIMVIIEHSGAYDQRFKSDVLATGFQFFLESWFSESHLGWDLAMGAIYPRAVWGLGAK